MASKEDMKLIHAYCKSRLLQKFDPALPISVSLPKLEEAHKGFYLGLVSSSNKDLARSGFLQDNMFNVDMSVENVIEAFFAELKGKGITANNLETGTLYVYLVKDVVYHTRPTEWDENKDGVYFMWGQDFKGLYLPYQIRLLSCSKIEVLDRLCSWEAGVPSSLWRLPEGLVWAIHCDSYPN